MNFILGVVAFIVVLTGCSSNEDALASVQSEANIQNVGGILKFKDQAVFAATVDSLSRLKESQQIDFLANYGIDSYKELQNMANEELDHIIDTVSSKAVFGVVLKTYREKYNNKFLFEKSNSEFISPISKLKDARLGRIVNTSGEYMIGDEVLKASMYSGIDAYQFSNNPQLNIATSGTMQRVVTSTIDNYGSVKTSDRKSIVTISLDKFKLIAHLSAQKKSWLGYWVSYNTIFSLQFKLNQLIFLPNNEGQLLSGTPHTYSNLIDDNDFDTCLGNFPSGIGMGTSARDVFGSFQLWSRGIAQKDGVAGKIKLNTLN